MPGRRRRRTDPAKEAYWRDLLQRWQTSGLSIRDFCRRHRLSQPSFYAWRRTLAQRDRDRAAATPAPATPTPTSPTAANRQSDSHRTPGPPTPTAAAPTATPLFVPVRLRASSAPTTSVGNATPFELVLPSGLVLRVPTAFDPVALQRLLAALGATSPEVPC